MNGELHGVPMTSQLWRQLINERVELAEERRMSELTEPVEAFPGSSEKTLWRNRVVGRRTTRRQCAEGTRYCPHNPACPR